jgi:hypothetical protein
MLAFLVSTYSWPVTSTVNLMAVFGGKINLNEPNYSPVWGSVLRERGPSGVK